MAIKATIAERRLRNQRLTGHALRQPADVVEWFGAMQAQEYAPARWAIGQRMQGGSDAAIQRAFDEGRILRTHVMRPTWHFVTPSDIRWLLELTAPRVHRILSYYNRALGLDARTLTRGAGVIERALGDGQQLTRAELAACLQRAGLPCSGQQLARVVMHAELERLICSGARRDRQFTYALLAHRAPKALKLSRDEPLATLARRFYASHGPATIRDFVWWSGLTSGEAKRALDMIHARREEIDGLVYWTVGDSVPDANRNHMAHLLPIYDEYLVAYRDRVAVPHGPRTVGSDRNGWITFQHALTIAGQVAGTWRVSRSARGVMVDAVPLRRVSVTERRALTAAAQRYRTFLGTDVELEIKSL